VACPWSNSLTSLVVRLYTADDERLSESRPRLRAEEFALDEITDEELDAFYAALAEA
jgi:hypothetical protein